MTERKTDIHLLVGDVYVCKKICYMLKMRTLWAVNDSVQMRF